MRPPEGSLSSCMNSNECINDEFCDQSSGAGVCRNNDLKDFDTRDVGDKFCSWCSYFKTDDCCSARSGARYVELARALEREVTTRDPNISSTNCQPQARSRVACLVDSICQENFGDTLKAIARDLVSSDKYTLDPPACNPEGVTVKIAGKTLKYLEDFEISEDGSELRLTGASPGPNDDVQIYFVVDGCSE